MAVGLSSLCALLKKYNQELFSVSLSHSLSFSLTFQVEQHAREQFKDRKDEAIIFANLPLRFPYFVSQAGGAPLSVFIFVRISSGRFLCRSFLLHRLLWHLKWENNYARKVRGPTFCFFKGPPPSDSTMHFQKILKNILQCIVVRSTEVKHEAGGHILEP